MTSTFGSYSSPFLSTVSGVHPILGLGSQVKDSSSRSRPAGIYQQNSQIQQSAKSTSSSVPMEIEATTQSSLKVSNTAKNVLAIPMIDHPSFLFSNSIAPTHKYSSVGSKIEIHEIANSNYVKIEFNPEQMKDERYDFTKRAKCMVIASATKKGSTKNDLIATCCIFKGEADYLLDWMLKEIVNREGAIELFKFRIFYHSFNEGELNYIQSQLNLWTQSAGFKSSIEYTPLNGHEKIYITKGSTFIEHPPKGRSRWVLRESLQASFPSPMQIDSLTPASSQANLPLKQNQSLSSVASFLVSHGYQTKKTYRE